MYILACKDLGSPDCAYVSKAETAEAAVADMKSHAMSAHADAVKQMASSMTEEQITAKMTAAVKTE